MKLEDAMPKNLKEAQGMSEQALGDLLSGAYLNDGYSEKSVIAGTLLLLHERLLQIEQIIKQLYFEEEGEEDVGN